MENTRPNFLKLRKKNLNKKGLSGVVSTLLLILLVLSTIAIVWKVVSDIIEERTSRSESCFGILDKLSLNSEYTCNNESSGELNIYISRGEIELDEILVSIIEEGGGKSFNIGENYSYSYVRNYSGSYNYKLVLPNKNAGRTYIVNITEIGIPNPQTIKIFPIINKETCDESDSLSSIGSC